MQEISAAEASRHFAAVLDAVEHRGTGADLRRILIELPPDDRWADDLQDLRRFVGETTTTDPWND